VLVCRIFVCPVFFSSSSRTQTRSYLKPAFISRPIRSCSWRLTSALSVHLLLKRVASPGFATEIGLQCTDAPMQRCNTTHNTASTINPPGFRPLYRAIQSREQKSPSTSQHRSAHIYIYIYIYHIHFYNMGSPRHSTPP
jgi:hypothetical protein